MDSFDLRHHFDSFVVDTPSEGCFLLSEPFLRDEHFSRTVVLVCEEGEGGVLGYVLNRKSPLSLKKVLSLSIKMDFPLFIGGPMQQDTLHVIHRVSHLEKESESLGNGIFWGKDIEKLLHLINKGKVSKQDVKFFMGYAGWEQEQFQDELKASAWVVNNHSRAKHVFDYPSETLWRMILKEMGGKYGMLADYPQDPSWN